MAKRRDLLKTPAVAGNVALNGAMARLSPFCVGEASPPFYRIGQLI